MKFLSHALNFTEIRLSEIRVRIIYLTMLYYTVLVVMLQVLFLWGTLSARQPNILLLQFSFTFLGQSGIQQSRQSQIVCKIWYGRQIHAKSEPTNKYQIALQMHC